MIRVVIDEGLGARSASDRAVRTQRRRRRSEAGFVSVALFISLGLVFAGLIYLFHRVIYLRAQQELRQAADSLALAAAAALREKGLRAAQEIDIDVGQLVKDVAEPNLTVTRIVETSVKVLGAIDEDGHETVLVDLEGELKRNLTFAGFSYGSKPFKARSMANIMRWVLTEERYPIVLLLADASDRMGDKAPAGGKQSHWEHLRDAIISYTDKGFPSRFGLVAFRDPRSMDQRSLTVGISQEGPPNWMLDLLKIPEYRITKGKPDEGSGELLTPDEMNGYREYMLGEIADEYQDSVRVLPTAKPRLDSWTEVQELLQKPILLHAGGHTNLGNALARAQQLIETNDAQEVDRTVLLVSNDRPFVPFDPAKQLKCSQYWFDGKKCEDLPDPEQVREAFKERASALRQLPSLGVSLAAIKLRNRNYAEIVCDIFNSMCQIAAVAVGKIKEEGSLSPWVVSGVERFEDAICNRQGSTGATSGEVPTVGGATTPEGAAGAKVDCEQTEGWAKKIYDKVVGLLRGADTIWRQVETELERFTGIMRVPRAMLRYFETRFSEGGTDDEATELEWIKPLAGGPFDEVGEDPRYYTQINTPSDEERIVMAMAHYGCVYDPLAPYRSRDKDDDPGRLEPGDTRSWAPFAFIRDEDDAEEPLEQLPDQEAVADIVDAHPWNADNGLESMREGYRLLPDRLLAVRLTMKSCEAVGKVKSNKLVIRWGPPRLGAGPEYN